MIGEIPATMGFEPYSKEESMVKRDVSKHSNVSRRSGEINDHNSETMRDSIRRQSAQWNSKQGDATRSSSSTQPPTLNFAPTPPRKDDRLPKLSFEDTPPCEPETKKIKLSFT